VSGAPVLDDLGYQTEADAMAVAFKKVGGC